MTDRNAALDTAGRRTGELGLNGWEGATWTAVEIIGETPKRYRIRALTRTKLAGRNRWLQPQDTALVPKTAIRSIQVIQHGAR